MTLPTPVIGAYYAPLASAAGVCGEELIALRYQLLRFSADGADAVLQPVFANGHQPKDPVRMRISTLREHFERVDAHERKRSLTPATSLAVQDLRAVQAAAAEQHEPGNGNGHAGKR